MEKLITIDEVASLLKMSKFTIYHYIHKNEIPHIKLAPGCVRFRLSDIEAWLQKIIESEKEKKARKRKARRPGRRCDTAVDRLIEEAKREVLS